jgi:hypothetical protein
MADEAAPQATVTVIGAIYTVQNPHITPSATRAIIQGKEMVATVDAFEVELVADSLSHGGIKLRFIGDEIPDAQTLFVNDSKVTATFKSAAEQK